MKVRCWKYGDASTALDVDTDDFDHAPDDFVHRCVAMRAGDVVFVQGLRLLEAGPVAGIPMEQVSLASVWRVECVAAADEFLVLATERTTASLVRRELAKHPGGRRGRPRFSTVGHPKKDK